MINIEKKEECCGCSACYSVCPKQCIKMKPDNEGFLYPEVDTEKCIECGLCRKVCRIINPVKEEKSEQKAFLVQHRNLKVRKQSTSGGAFTAIAEYVIKKGGVVFGAGFDENYTVRHQYAESFRELKKFRNSKYVQSEIGDSFLQVRKFLESERLVCFSGTPCQVEGLLSYLKKSYDNLITVDVVCRAVPSPALWKKYLQLKSENRQVKNAKFRDKNPYGYEYSQITVTLPDRKLKCGVESDPYLRAFFSNLSDRPSCYDCHFRKRYRLSDLTIWDCFDVGKFDRKLDDNTGVTRVLVHSEKGRKIMNFVAGNNICVEISPDDAVEGVHEMKYSVERNPKRADFFRDLDSMETASLFEKYFPMTAKVRIEKFVRNTSEKLGIYRYVKKFALVLLGKKK